MPNQRYDKKRILAIFLIFVFFIGAKYASDYVLKLRAEKEAASGYPMTRDTYLLDTYCALTVYAGNGEEALDAAIDALNSYDNLLNYSKAGSDLYNINHRENDTVAISEDCYELLQICYDFCDKTDGVLEPAIRPVTSLWDFKVEKKVPDKAALAEAMKQVKSQQWEVKQEANAYTFHALDDEAKIDVGAVAKGFIADKVKAIMVEKGVTSGIINLGGNVLCIGKKPDGSNFQIAVRDPGKTDGYAYALELNDNSAVTAGAYERCFEENGVRYHHIIDPSTGYSAQTGLESVTIVGPISGICDALSTSVFIMGEEKGKEFLEKYNKENKTDYQAYFLAQE